jgi:uncharacterized protein (TIGR03066 family)
MQFIRMAAVAVSVFGVTSLAVGQPAKNKEAGPPKELVREWRVTKAEDMSTDMSIDFHKDSTFQVRRQLGEGLTKDGRRVPGKVETVAEGKYTIEGQKLTMTMRGREEKQVFAIKKLTDKALVLEDMKGKLAEFAAVPSDGTKGKGGAPPAN